jgi:hypothetical protein
MIITTTKGEMDDVFLVKKTGEFDNDNEHTTWVEYWINGEIVHRSAHVVLKQSVFSNIQEGGF